MKIWIYCTGLKHPAIYSQTNEFKRIDIFVSRALINSKYVARYSSNIFCFMLITDSFILTLFSYSKLKYSPRLNHSNLIIFLFCLATLIPFFGPLKFDVF